MTISPPAPTDVTRLWYTRCPVPTASSIAISRGLLAAEFAPDGIEVSSLLESADSAVRESHFDHTRADSFRQGGNIPPIWSRSKGRDLRLIGLSWAEQYQAILALPESGITGPEDLRGRRLALPHRVNDQIDFTRATALRGYHTALALAGLAEDEVKFVDIAVPETFLGQAGSPTGSLFGARNQRTLNRAEIIALLRGEVDAVYLSGSRGADFEAFLGAVRVVDIAALPDRAQRVNNITPATLTVSGGLLDQRPDLVARYVASTLRAARWAEEHADETRRIIAAEVGSAEEWVDHGHPLDLHSRLTPSLDEDLIAAVESQKDFLLRNGFITTDFDVREWIDPEPLRRAQELIEND
ncbi:ABC transporter substrate-binding protein [Acrocarpospora catenulata]|uniref:ABC transporter substrate-binding protein n=1 Tax=Acrocarpospora catenulata TaxID=2836182 RepID=UPI001BD9A7A4|nr:ABC transporter substrate-binding protein [Acrocarpospora catenulata]